MHEGRVVLGAGGTVVLPTQDRRPRRVHRHLPPQQARASASSSRPTRPAHEDLYIPQGENGGAITGDVVRAKITSTRPQATARRSTAAGSPRSSSARRSASSARSRKQARQWIVLPDGNTLTEPILTPDAASRHIKPGTKVVVELTQLPRRRPARPGVITEVLGQAGEKDVDLKSVIVQFNLPGPFPEEVVLTRRAQSLDRVRPRRGAHAPARPDRRDHLHDRPRRRQGLRRRDQPAAARQAATGSWACTSPTSRYFVPADSPLDDGGAGARQQLLLPRPRHPDAAGDPEQRRVLAPGSRAAAVQERVHHLRRRRWCWASGTRARNTRSS